MNSEYVSAEIEVIEFSSFDVLTASDVEDAGEGMPWG